MNTLICSIGCCTRVHSCISDVNVKNSKYLPLLPKLIGLGFSFCEGCKGMASMQKGHFGVLVIGSTVYYNILAQVSLYYNLGWLKKD